MSKPGCPCFACAMPALSSHDVLVEAEMICGTSFRMPSGQMCEMLTDSWKKSSMCPWVSKSAWVQSGAALPPTPGCMCSACDPTRRYNLHDQLELAESGFKPFLNNTKGVQSILIRDMSAPTMNIFPGFMPTPVAPEPKPEEPKYSDATVVRLTELLLESQRKGRMSGSMHDLATKLLEGLYDGT